jgi:hypothetical protein
VTFTTSGSIENADITSGRGGGTGGTGTGGDGGLIERVKITQLHSLVSGSGSSQFYVEAGSGGGSSHGAAGSASGIKGLTITDKTGGGNHYEVRSGAGGTGSTTGGTGGTADGITLAGPLADIWINSDGAANGGDALAAGGVAGKGGAVKNVSGKAGYLAVFAGLGGDATASGGQGGDGGAIDAINVAVTVMAQQIASGSGGDGGNAGGGTGGTGGLITNVKIGGTGDLGNFAKNFGTGLFEMGGLFAGLAGSGQTAGITGSINGVSAKRIAAILAAAPNTDANNLTALNAVHDLANITATSIGADVNAPAGFTFINAGGVGFNLGDGDTALDGLVIVRDGAGTVGDGFAEATVNTLTDSSFLFRV